MSDALEIAERALEHASDDAEVYVGVEHSGFARYAGSEVHQPTLIDDKRLNFQFGTQIAWEIKQGKRGRMLRDATYTGITPQFWGSLDAVAGRDEWQLYGLTNCGKGQPGQSAHVSHGAAPARFRQVQVGVKS